MTITNSPHQNRFLEDEWFLEEQVRFQTSGQDGSLGLLPSLLPTSEGLNIKERDVVQLPTAQEGGQDIDDLRLPPSFLPSEFLRAVPDETPQEIAQKALERAIEQVEKEQKSRRLKSIKESLSQISIQIKNIVEHMRESPIDTHDEYNKELVTIKEKLNEFLLEVNILAITSQEASQIAGKIKKTIWSIKGMFAKAAISRAIYAQACLSTEYANYTRIGKEVQKKISNFLSSLSRQGQESEMIRTIPQILKQDALKMIILEGKNSLALANSDLLRAMQTAHKTEEDAIKYFEFNHVKEEIEKLSKYKSLAQEHYSYAEAAKTAVNITILEAERMLEGLTKTNRQSKNSM